MDPTRSVPREWLAVASTPNGEVKLFGDSKDSVVRKAEEQGLSICDVFPLVRLAGRKFACQTGLDTELKATDVERVPGTEAKAVLGYLQLYGLSIHEETPYKRQILNAINLALLCGRESLNQPAETHWLRPYWNLGRDKACATHRSIQALPKPASRV